MLYNLVHIIIKSLIKRKDEVNTMIKVAICGYGNLGKGVEKALSNPDNKDLKLTAIFTRRNPEEIQSVSGVDVISIDEIEKYSDKIDVVILCGGSATDLPEQGPKIARMFNTVDSFDTHAKIPEYFAKMNNASSSAGKVSIISVGWDPGMFSIARAYSEAILPIGKTYTFWGKGVSQGHSDAIRRIDGVKDAKQYTIPLESAMNKVRAGENPELTAREKHLRECYVVAEEGADLDEITKKIKEMPNYFADYDTIVHFVSQSELDKNHSAMPHGGFVIRSGNTCDNKQIIEYSLKLESNPEFTGSILVAYARAAFHMHNKLEVGAKTVFDVPPALLSNESAEELIKRLL